MKYLGYAFVTLSIIQYVCREYFSYGVNFITGFAIAGIFFIMTDLVELMEQYYDLKITDNKKKEDFNETLGLFKKYKTQNPGTNISRQYKQTEYDINNINWFVTLCGKNKRCIQKILYTLAIFSAVILNGLIIFSEMLKDPITSARLNDLTVLMSIGLTLIIIGIRNEGTMLGKLYKKEHDKILWSKAEMKKYLPQE